MSFVIYLLIWENYKHVLLPAAVVIVVIFRWIGSCRNYDSKFNTTPHFYIAWGGVVCLRAIGWVMSWGADGDRADPWRILSDYWNCNVVAVAYFIAYKHITNCYYFVIVNA